MTTSLSFLSHRACSAHPSQAELATASKLIKVSKISQVNQERQERQENTVSVDHSLRVLRIQQVAEKLSIGKSTIYDWLNEKSPRYDSSFPKPIKLSSKSIGWLSTEIDTWLLARVEQSRVSVISANLG